MASSLVRVWPLTYRAQAGHDFKPSHDPKLGHGLQSRTFPPQGERARRICVRSLAELGPLLLDDHHPADAETVGDHAEALCEERLAERHSHLSLVGKRLEHAIGLGFVLGV